MQIIITIFTFINVVRHQRNADNTDWDVSYSQWDEKVVADGPQAFISLERDQHEWVAQDCRQTQ